MTTEEVDAVQIEMEREAKFVLREIPKLTGPLLPGWNPEWNDDTKHIEKQY